MLSILAPPPPNSSALPIPSLRRSIIADLRRPSVRLSRRLTPLCVAAAAAEGTLYEVLGIPAVASGCEIKAAYRRLARACHPDAVAVAERKGASADEFMRVNAAYTTLSDPERRAEYDRRVMLAATRVGSDGGERIFRPLYTARACGGCGHRTWETDQCW